MPSDRHFHHLLEFRCIKKSWPWAPHSCAPPAPTRKPLGDSFTFSPLILHRNEPLFNATGWAATTPSDTGWSNQIAYTTPKFGGFQANFQYPFGELPGTTARRTSAPTSFTWAAR